MPLDSRWKFPQGKSPEHLYDALYQLIRELRKGEYLSASQVSYDGSASGIAGTTVQAALDTSRQQGKTTLWVPANEMVAATGATLATIDFGGGLTLPVRQFDPGATEFALFSFAPPKSWNEGTISAQFYWAHPAATAFGVVWALGAASFGNDDALTNVYASVSVTDVGGTTNDLYISSETAALNPGNTEVEGDLLALFAARVATDGADTLDVDAYLLGIKLFYTTNAGNDA